MGETHVTIAPNVTQVVSQSQNSVVSLGGSITKADSVVVSITDGATVNDFNNYSASKIVYVYSIGSCTIAYDATKIVTDILADLPLSAGDTAIFAQVSANLWRQFG